MPGLLEPDHDPRRDPAKAMAEERYLAPCGWGCDVPASVYLAVQCVEMLEWNENEMRMGYECERLYDW